MYEADYAGTYSKMSTVELEDLAKNGRDLVPEAQSELKRQLESRNSSVPIAVEPVDHAYKTENGVLVKSKVVKFPTVCPSCLAPNPRDFVSIASNSKTTNWVLFRKVQYKKFSVPFCTRCARRIRVFRNTEIVIVILSACIGEIAKALYGFSSLIVCIASGLLMLFIANRLDIKDKSVLTVISDVDDSYTQIQFASRVYEDAFLRLNL